MISIYKPLKHIDQKDFHWIAQLELKGSIGQIYAFGVEGLFLVPSTTILVLAVPIKAPPTALLPTEGLDPFQARGQST